MSETKKLIYSNIIGAIIVGGIGTWLLDVESAFFGMWINAFANGYYYVNGGWK